MELESVDEEIEINILSVLPHDRPDIVTYLNRKLNKVKFGKSRVNIVTPGEAEAIVRKAKKEIEAHEG